MERSPFLLWSKIPNDPSVALLMNTLFQYKWPGWSCWDLASSCRALWRKPVGIFWHSQYDVLVGPWEILGSWMLPNIYRFYIGSPTCLSPVTPRCLLFSHVSKPCPWWSICLARQVSLRSSGFYRLDFSSSHDPSGSHNSRTVHIIIELASYGSY